MINHRGLGLYMVYFTASYGLSLAGFYLYSVNRSKPRGGAILQELVVIEEIAAICAKCIGR